MKKILFIVLSCFFMLPSTLSFAKIDNSYRHSNRNHIETFTLSNSSEQDDNLAINFQNEIKKNTTKQSNDNMVTGIWGSVSWEFDLDTKTLKFTSSGTLGEYASSPWNTGIENIDDISYIIFSEKVFAPEDSTNLFSQLQYLVSINATEIDTTNVKIMTNMFSENFRLQKLDLKNFDTSSVTDMSGMFFQTFALEELDVSSFDTSNVTSMSNMFNFSVGLFNINLSNFDTSSVTDMSYMFYGLSVSEINLSNFDTSNVTDMSFMFAGNNNLKSLNISNFITAKVTSMESMFEGLSSMEELDVSSFSTNRVENMTAMFARMENLKHLEILNFDTSSVIEMSSMFDSCMSLEELDLSSFRTPNVKNMNGLFYFTAYLKKLNISNFITNEDTEINEMFTSDFYLEEIVMSPFFRMDNSAGLEELVADETYTGNWQNIGSGNNEMPTGKNIWTSAEFMKNYRGETDADTYIWQKKRDEAAHLIIKYQDTKGNEISPAQSVSGKIGDPYTISIEDYNISIAGYTFKNTDGPLSGFLGYSEQSVTFIYEKTPIKGADVNVHYTDTDGNTIAPDVVKSGNVGDSYTTEQLAIDGYTFKEVQGNATGTFTADPQEVTYIYQKDIKVGGNVTVEYWEYDSSGTPVKKIHDDTIITGNVGERYHAEAYYVTGYGFSGVNTETGLSPISGLITDATQTVKLIYNKLTAAVSDGLVLIQYQDDQGNVISENDLSQGKINTAYEIQPKTIEGYTLKDTIGNTKGIYNENVQVVTYIYTSNDVPDEVLVPVWRAYNLNDGDHLYTTSKDEYDWIVGLKWQAEGVAFQSVLSSYEQAVPVFRLYNPNSGEHFYTVSQSEYHNVASKGWKKEGTGFYMVPKEKGHPIYRVFNPNATGPGSHLFTRSKTEADWLIGLGWNDEGIAFYSPR
ncbi:BspA family leucine-rich repeat surface protein [Enterococcus sp. ALS3]|uniref:BspA family leucine-rich repeat surface protein n=1 Tax=Enterococcus alishanensis TaxID=1303817 RepID=A0ABS6TI01_9ENTE|nr:MucBP domain-containing protein [Enterococcus alishanensis]MBV7392533.1 BspA family leucine-rich repeat surface protein [Enterococcus alishanensis]